MEEENLIDRETTCTVCYAEFLDPEDLVIHIEQVHWTDSCRKCDFCPSVYRCLDDYALHIISTHLLSLKACKYCHRIYDNFNMLRKHENKHPNLRREGTFYCSQCMEVFSTTHDLAEHELTKHNYNQDGVFLNELFPLLSAKLHIKALTFIMSLRETAAYICPCCMLTVNDPSQYLDHLPSNMCSSTVCSKCCNVYKDKKGLVRHFKTHKECFLDTKPEDLIRKCSKCEKHISLESYKEHVKTCKPIKCHVCNIIMESMYKLSQHQSDHHPMTIQMKTCKFCRKEFVGSVALQRHFNRKHLTEVHLYKYKCVYCENMYYKHPQNLFGHLYTKHQDIMPFSCTICDKKFRMRKSFTIHIKMVHNSAGAVEFDENYNVFFNEKKSEDPFTPTCLFPELIPEDNLDQSDIEQTSHNIDAPTDIQTDASTDLPTDIPTDVPTDVQTDTEEKKIAVQKKPPKIRYKEEIQAAKSQCEKNVSEAQTDNINQKPKLKRGKYRKLRERKIKKQMFHEDKGETDSDDEPLIKVKRNSKSWNRKNTIYNKKQRLTCNLCKKYCFTLLHYNHHMSLHFKDEVKKCVKCSQEFSSKKALETHIAEKHSSSRLTETLKNLLERRKQTKNGTLPELTPSEKFKKTIKRAKLDTIQASVTIKEINENLSVQKFIEEFTPEETNKETKDKNSDIQSSISVEALNHTWPKQPTIKMVKFIPPPPLTNVKLALPVRFKEVACEKPKITCRVVHKPITPYQEEHDIDQGEDNIDHYEEHYDESQDKLESVPDVAHEVMLETQEQPRKPIPIPHKILLPKLPKNFKNEDIKIAHLLPEAPYFKIVKMTDVLKQPQDNNAESGMKEEKDDDENIQLPAGTKLVNVNPLAHLLGDTSVEQILGNKHKSYYKPKSGNFQKAIAKALLKLEQPQPPRQSNKRKKKDPEINESVKMFEAVAVKQ